MSISQFNPFSPDIKMHILLTVLHAFLMELARRMCLNIKTSGDLVLDILSTGIFEQVLIM